MIDDWDGPDDPDNPRNWSLAKRAYHSAIPALFGFAVTFGTSVYSPSVSNVMEDLHVSRTGAILGLTIFTLGLGYGPVFSAPLSEKYGRKIVYMASAPIFMLFTLGSALSKNLAALLVCRLFAGLTGSPALAVGAGTNVDLFPPHTRAVTTSVFMIAPFLGPSLGPVIGGFAVQHKGWRWSQWSLLIITAAVFLAAIPMMETYKVEILRKRAKRRGLSSSLGETHISAKKAVMQNLVRPLHMLITESAVFFFSLYVAFAFGVLFLFFAAFPFVFQRPPYNMDTEQTGLLFLAIGVGASLGGVTGIVVDRHMYQKHHRHAVSSGKGYAAPEHRLYSAMIGSLGLPLGLFWFGWTAEKGMHWAIPAAAAIPFAWGNMCIFIAAVLYIVDVYGPLNGASAMAGNGILRYTLGGVFPLFTIQMYEKLGIGWATSLLGFVSVLMLPIPWIFYKYGPAIRRRSRYPTAM
ncbi:MFS general substrate transporter [Sporormia fimetaria CBS 119925]|uniref:MFS general substrate transporter n=1 Tax=Sporormia fimetaria CBS 119925 TaxID=1340428 RepID=A0A6A6UXD3_9PLEO|nr:MFS general substrate transporter [Sporormia fimetaria CBS 119925]